MWQPNAPASVSSVLRADFASRVVSAHLPARTAEETCAVESGQCQDINFAKTMAVLLLVGTSTGKAEVF